MTPYTRQDDKFERMITPLLWITLLISSTVVVLLAWVAFHFVSKAW